MRGPIRWVIPVLLLLLLSPAAYAQNLVANLTGAAEVPGPGDPDGSGTANITISGTSVCYSIVVNNITLPPTGSHIHSGVAGVAGPIVVPLNAPWVGNTQNGCEVVAPATAAAIAANPSAFYVNVHTADFQGGAVRGQLQFAPAIPTMSTWGLIALAGVLALAGFVVMRRF